MKLVSKEDLEKVWKAWKRTTVCTTVQYEATHAYYRYLKTRRRYETGN